MIFVDSSVWIQYFCSADTPESLFLDSAIETVPVATGDVVLLEVLRGFRRDREYEEASAKLLTLSVFSMLGINMSLKAAQNYRLLRKKGITIRKSADAVIATFCIENNLPLLHQDRDFLPFEEYLGLRNAFYEKSSLID